MAKLCVLFATSEAYPLVKTGGLADIGYSLPHALQKLDIDVRVLLPGYPSVMEQIKKLKYKVVYENLKLFTHSESVQLLEAQMPESTTTVYVIDSPGLYRREGTPYQDISGQDWRDNPVRFGTLSKVAALFGEHAFEFKPDLLHCNDWQTALAPAYLFFSEACQVKTLMSVHNLAHQGVFGPEIVSLLELPAESFNMYGLEYYGLMSFLKAGLYYSDWISTVSPTYAKEIQTPTFGYGLYDLLAHHRNKLTGILNGIDTEEWNPEIDVHIQTNYSHERLSEKAQNTRSLRQQLGLDNTKSPLIGMITRLTHQKGIDLVIPVVPQILQEGAQIVLLGAGDKDLEDRLQNLANKYPKQMSVTFGYDEKLAHQIEAGADIFLMPSRFEPCGLNQMYSMRYGTIPIVRYTGGLADTVVDTTPANVDANLATGFTFEREDSQEVLRCVQRALLSFRDKTTWKTLQVNGMVKDFSWDKSAQEYAQLYQKLVKS